MGLRRDERERERRVTPAGYGLDHDDDASMSRTERASEPNERETTHTYSPIERADSDHSSCPFRTHHPLCVCVCDFSVTAFLFSIDFRLSTTRPPRTLNPATPAHRTACRHCRIGA